MSHQDPYFIPYWWDWNYWEPTILQVLPDFCHPGDVVFDVGMNVGGLSLAMSRLVGPRGHVCAFEASPRIVKIAQSNMNIVGCHNVTIYNKSVYRQSGERVRIYGSVGHYNDSIYHRSPTNEIYSDVSTMSIDDFVAHTGLVPKFIKMDIEGAEHDALQGARHVLHQYHPPLILEQSPADTACFDLLSDIGYKAVNLSNYKTIREKSDLASNFGVTNILYLKCGDDSPYLSCSMKETMRFSKRDIVARSEQEIGLREPIRLPPGRYIFEAAIAADGINNEVHAGLDDDARKHLVRMHTHTRFIANSYSNWCLALDHEKEILPYIRFVHGNDDTLVWSGITLYNIPEFGTAPRFSLY